MKLKFILFILIYIFLFRVDSIYSQNNSNCSKDSLSLKLANAKHDSDKINILINNANQTHSFEPIEAKKQATNALDLAKKIGFEKGAAKANRIIGIISYKQGDLSKALKHYFDCLSYYEKTNDLKGMASLYNNIGLLYGAKHDFQKSINYHKKSLAIKEKLNDEYGKAASYNNIGIIYSDIDLIDSSKLYHEKALEIRLKINDINGLGTSYYNIANNYFDLNNNKKSLEFHYKALNMFRITDDYFNFSFCMNEIAMNHLNLNEENKCKQYADSALQIAIKNEIKEAEMEVYKTFYFMYNKLKDPVNELKYYKLFSELKIKLSNESQAAEIGKMETKFEYENKIKLQELEQEKKDVLQNAESKKQKMLIAAIAIILVLVVIFSFFLYNRFKVIQKQNKLIEHQKQIVDEKAAELSVRQKEILDSIHYAKRIQNTLLAHKEFVDQNITNNFIYFNPKDIVSGDFYWATKKENYFYLAICDSTGHGVPGAFMSLLSIGFLSEAINEKNILEPNKVFDYVRMRLIDSVSKDGQKDGFDGILLQLNLGTKEIKYAAANNAPIQVSNGNIIELEKDKMPVGHGERKEDFKLFSINANMGDTLYLYTDGFADQFGGPKGKKYKYKQLNELLANNSNKALTEQSDLLCETFNSWKGNLEQVDDVCVVGIRI
jgi:serine phosphatase RsbU (regulator of sigma subunit)